MRGLDPRIHPLREMMDGRVKPGHDSVLGVAPYSAGTKLSTRTCGSMVSANDLPDGAL